MDERGRLPGSRRLGSSADQTSEKSVSSLLSRNPRPGTTMPDPPVCSIVRVYSTTSPVASTTVRLVVEMFSVSASAWERVSPHAADDASTSPGATGLVSAWSGSTRQVRSAAKSSESSVSSGTSTKAGSPRYLARSAKDSALASR
jgi:hypothetical protein